MDEESFELKRTFWMMLLAAAAVSLLPMSGGAQVPEAAPPAAPSYKYSAELGLGYTSLNQVNESRHGLIGPKLTLTRDWGKYFALRVTGEYEKYAAGNGGTFAQGGNPGNPSVYSVLAGPEIHANVYGPVDALFFFELGMEHTGGEQMNPASSFAGGFGGGARWRLNERWSLEASGDRVAASFSLINNTPQAAYSTHRTWNPRGTFGVRYRF